MKIAIRPASTNDAPTLTDLALRSKAHWGYDDAFMAACQSELTTTADDIRVDVVRVAVGEADTALGYYKLTPCEDDNLELCDLFVDPDQMGKGVGRALIRHAQEEATALGHDHLVIFSDPHAESFYMAMGAERVGQVASGSVQGRTLPLLHIPSLPTDR